jgi:hypothetical protein
MKSVNRKTAPKVTFGRVQKKNNWTPSPDYYIKCEPDLVIDRLRPGDGFRHLSMKKDIVNFISILPDWTELSKGLNAIVLSPGSYRLFGYHTRGVVHICAWDRDIWITLGRAGYEQEKEYLDRFGVECVVQKGDRFLCKFTESSARAHQLLATLLHELGHHHDRMTTRSKLHADRGEQYAFDYASQYTELIWERYLDVFGI